MIKFYRLFLIFTFTLICFVSFGQSATEIKKAEDFINKKGEVYFTFTSKSKININNLSKHISIDNMKLNSSGEYDVFAYANKKEFNTFLSNNTNFEVLPHPGEIIKNPKMLDDPLQRDITSWDYFPTYSAYITMMYQFETLHPDICRIVNIGQTNNGRDILYAVISDNVNNDEAEPRFNYSSSMHGDETTGYVLSLRLIDYLLANYGADPQATSLVNGAEIWINPLANPDGTYFGGNNSVSGAIRYNANYVDINRNFPDYDDGPHPDGNPWQTETEIFMALADSLHFVMGANFHGGAEVANYPWDTQVALHPDDNWWQYVSRQWVDSAQFYGPVNYMTQLNNGITNGYAWYTITGGRQDYYNYYNRCREVTLEISNTKNPDPSTLPGYWNANYRSLLNYINQVLYGVNGIVTDSITGAPLLANVFISGHDEFNTDVFTSLPYGDYYRPLYAGTYNITYSSQGYTSKTISTTIVNSTALIQNVQLVPSPPLVNFISDAVESCTGEIHFTDMTNTSPGSTYLWSFGDGTTSTDISPVHFYTSNGIFDISLTVTNSIGTDILTMPSLININMPLAPAVLNDSLCGSGTATFIADGTGTINWYDDISSNIPVFTGSTFVTGILTATEDFYVERVAEQSPQYSGKPDNTGGGGYYSANSVHYLVFDCVSPVTLESVKVYADSPGNRTITLKDNSGTTISSSTVYINSGEQVITLNFEIPAGVDYQLAGPPSPGLYRNNAGLSYPYEIPGLISVKYSSASTDPTGYYYFFYDWKIKESDCISPRVQVSAIVSDDVPVAGFTYLQSLDSVGFTNTSTNGGLYHWDFGDGETSTDENPYHFYPNDGLYTVTLTSWNACGTDIFSVDINILVTVAEDIIYKNNFIIYPNPSDGLFNVTLKTEVVSDLVFELHNLLGEKIISVNTVKKQGEYTTSFDFKYLPDGIYFLSAKSELYNLTKKIIIRK